jgi:CSLREA domain-containing protein
VSGTHAFSFSYAGRRLLGVLTVALLALVCSAGGARADLYWTNFQDAFNEGTESFIGHARLNGSEANGQFLPVGLTHPARMAANGEYIYASFETGSGGGIGRAKLDGSEHDPFFITAGTPNAPVALPGGVKGIAVTKEFIYWSNTLKNEEPSEIGRARIDGSEVNPDFITIPEDKQAIDLTVQGNHIFYAEVNAIGRVNVNGSEDEPAFIESEGETAVGFPWGIAADAQHIYWIGAGQIGRADNTPGGGDIEPKFISGLTETGTGGLTIDAQHIYWANQEGEAIGRASLAGGAIEQQWITGAGNPEGITIDSRIIVNSTADFPDADPADGICAAKEHESQCTLRAAIETVNGLKKTEPVQVAVEIPGGKLETVSLGSALPKVESPIALDARSQPGALIAGTRKIGLIVDGKGAGEKANGLQLATGAEGSTLAGLQIQGFGGDGVLLEGENEQLADSVLTSDSTGAEVAGNHDVVGVGAGLAGDIFFADGKQGIVKYMETLAKSKVSDEQLEIGLDVLGADVDLSKPSTGTHIVGDDIGIHGPGFSEASDKLAEDGVASSFAASTSALPIGIMIAPGKEGAVREVTVGGPGEEANVDSGTMFGLMAVGGESPIEGLTVHDSSFGTDTTGEPLEPFGGLFGVFAAGHVHGLSLGGPSAGNKFEGMLMATLIGGSEVEAPIVQGNTYGHTGSIGADIVKEGLRGHDAFGLMLADAQGAQIGGTTAGQGNSFPGTIVAVGLDGLHIANDTIAGNTIGTAPSTPFTTFYNSPDEYSTIFGLLVGDITSGFEHVAAQNLLLQNNTIQGAMGGLFESNIKGLTMVGNRIENDAIGMLDSGSGGERIGGSGAGEGNLFLNNGLGLLDVSEDPSTSQLEQATVNTSDTSDSTRSTYLSAPDESLAFDGVDAITTAELSPSSANTSAAPGTGNSILGNRFGVDSSGVAHPDELPLIVGGDEHSLQFGGTGVGQGNVIEHNRSGGLLIGGKTTHVPSVQILGNTIYDNENFTSPLPIPGLGINLTSEEGIGVGVLGVDPQDPTQPDGGANGSQNSPLLSSAVSAAGQLTVTGTLHGVANTNYLIEVFVDERQNPFKAGEGETLLGRLSLTTDAAGNVGFAAAFAAPGTTYEYVSSTATTVPGGGAPGVTSEFSLDAKIDVLPSGSTPPPISTPTSPPPSPEGAASTGVKASGSTASTGTASVTLPAKVSCSSATTSPCTVTTTVTVAAAGKASVSATLAANKRKPLTIGKGTLTLHSGATGALHFKLTAHGLSLLRARHTLAITVTVKISGHGRPTLTRVLHLHLKYKKLAKRK